MDRRPELHAVFESICDHVYFQPPASLTMVYPAIVYRRDPSDVKFADNNPYSVTRQYEVTLIARDPDSAILAALEALPMTRHDRFFVADNLSHDVLNIYF